MRKNSKGINERTLSPTKTGSTRIPFTSACVTEPARGKRVRACLSVSDCDIHGHQKYWAVSRQWHHAQFAVAFIQKSRSVTSTSTSSYSRMTLSHFAGAFLSSLSWSVGIFARGPFTKVSRDIMGTKTELLQRALQNPCSHACAGRRRAGEGLARVADGRGACRLVKRESVVYWYSI